MPLSSSQVGSHKTTSNKFHIPRHSDEFNVALEKKKDTTIHRKKKFTLSVVLWFFLLCFLIMIFLCFDLQSNFRNETKILQHKTAAMQAGLWFDSHPLKQHLKPGFSFYHSWKEDFVYKK